MISKASVRVSKNWRSRTARHGSADDYLGKRTKYGDRTGGSGGNKRKKVEHESGTCGEKKLVSLSESRYLAQRLRNDEEAVEGKNSETTGVCGFPGLCKAA